MNHDVSECLAQAATDVLAASADVGRGPHGERGEALYRAKRGEAVYVVAREQVLRTHVVRIDDRAAAADGHRFRQGSYGQICVDRRRESGGQLDALMLDAAEAGQREGDGVRARP